MAINIDRYTVESKNLIGKILPFFLRGNKMARFLTAISSPLDKVNEMFQKWVYNTLIDTATTSQVIVLKWSLKIRLQEYLLKQESEFKFDTYERNKYTTLYEDQSEQSNYSDNKIYMPEDAKDSSIGKEFSQIIIRDKNELTSETNEILIIAPPHNSKISDNLYIKKIRQYIETYLIYNIEYKIVISKN